MSSLKPLGSFPRIVSFNFVLYVKSVFLLYLTSCFFSNFCIIINLYVYFVVNEEY